MRRLKKLYFCSLGVDTYACIITIIVNLLSYCEYCYFTYVCRHFKLSTQIR